MTKRVAVLMGGWSSEREVSLVSGQAVVDAARALDCTVIPVDVGRDVASILADLKPDVAFNALHGRFGEDGCIQGVLELLGIPYTHSGVLASALAMNKPAAKQAFAGAGLRCPEGRLVSRAEFSDGDVLPRPYVVKPPNEGSSVGVHIVLNGDNVDPDDIDVWHFSNQALVERYIPGREIQVAVMGDDPLGAIEIKPKGRFYDYEAKYTGGRALHVMPAEIHPSSYGEALAIARTAHRALGCRGVTRADLRYDDTRGEPGTFYLLEINTQPGMTPLSLVPEIAAHRGIEFVELVQWLIEDASCDR